MSHKNRENNLEREVFAGLNLPHSQIQPHHGGLKHETLIIPSTSQVNSFNGSMIVFDIKEKSLVIDDISLQFNINPIGGLSNQGTNYPRFVNQWEFFTRIEYVVNNVVLDTQYSTELFLLNQLFNDEPNRIMENALGSNYSDDLRNAQKAAGTNDYIIKLKSFFRQAKWLCLNENHTIQLRVYLKTSSDVVIVDPSALNTGTPSTSINYSNVVIKAIKLPSNLIQTKYMELSKRNFHYLFWDTRYQTNTLASGIQQASIVLSSITGRCPYLFFVVRNTGQGNSNATINQFLQLKNFTILDAGGASLVGGQLISDTLNLEHAVNWSLSQYQLEDYAYVYVWSFSKHPSDAHHTGKALGHHEFKGSEQLQIQFNSPTQNSVVVDIYAATECVVEQSHHTVRKLIL